MLPKSEKNRSRAGQMLLTSRPFLTLLLTALALVATAPAALAVSCTTQGAMSPADREAMITAATPLAAAVAAQNFSALQAALLPAVTSDWESIRGVAQSAAPLVKGGEVRWRNVYALDATELKAPADAQFFCTNVDGSVTVTVTLHSLPPGRYALVFADFPGASLSGQLAMILGLDTTWKLGGLFAREGALEGHDGIWYWTRARTESQKAQNWSPWFTYDTARWLLLPVDFLSSPNLEQLNREQSQLKSNPQEALPLTVKSSTDAAKTWRITALHLDTTLHFNDLAVVYESTGLTDPQASRAEAIAVMSALLKLHPELRDSLHGLWAYAEKDGTRSYAIEQAIHDIP